MRVVVSDRAMGRIAEQGGRLYIWPHTLRCCGGGTLLESSPSPRAGTAFRRVPTEERFELYLPGSLSREPDELHIDTSRFRGRVEAFWNGCAWVI
jgi:hypothetical protein